MQTHYLKRLFIFNCCMRSLYTDVGSKFARIYADNKHKLTLKSVRPSINNSPPLTSRFAKSHRQGRRFQRIERVQDIIHENNRFLERLLSISTSEDKTPEKSTAGPKSLNRSLRKQETARIYQENEAMAKRLEDKRPTLNSRALLKQFLVSRSYRKNISNVQSFEVSPKIPYFHNATTKHSFIKESFMKGINVAGTVLKSREERSLREQ